MLIADSVNPCTSEACFFKSPRSRVRVHHPVGSPRVRHRRIRGLSGWRHSTSRLQVRVEHSWLSRARLRFTRHRAVAHVASNQFGRSA